MLNFKNNEHLKLVWGGIFSVLLILSTIALLMFNCYTYFKDRTPSILNSEQFIGDTPTGKIVFE